MTLPNNDNNNDNDDNNKDYDNTNNIIPNVDKLLLIDVNSLTCLGASVRLILESIGSIVDIFSLPAKSTNDNLEWCMTVCPACS